MKRKPTPCSWNSRPIFEKLIEPLRETARRHGYALAVHGSLKRDIDLVACPWIDNASSAGVLAAAIQRKARKVTGFAVMIDYKPPIAQNPEKKPHGRLAWSIVLGGGPYIDLSVMPTRGKGRR